MNAPTRQGVRLAVTALGFAGLMVVVSAVPGAATTPQLFSSQVLGRGTDASHGTIPIQHGLDVVVAMITQKPGGSSGWHSHPGGAIVVVQQGEVTIFSSVSREDAEDGEGRDGQRCQVNPYTAGQSFIELPGEVAFAKNTSPGDLIVYATFPGVPPTIYTDGWMNRSGC